jgi:hypothetical protein
MPPDLLLPDYSCDKLIAELSQLLINYKLHTDTVLNKINFEIHSQKTKRQHLQKSQPLDPRLIPIKKPVPPGIHPYKKCVYVKYAVFPCFPNMTHHTLSPYTNRVVAVSENAVLVRYSAHRITVT